QGGQCSCRALVAGLGAGTLNGLLDGINGQYAEGKRYAELHGHLGQALGAFASYVFEVRSTTTNHRTEGDDGVEITTLGDFLRNQRDFEGTRRADDGDVAFTHA